MNARPIPLRRRRAAVLAAALILLAAMNLVVVSALSASGDDARIGALRLQSLRSFYAAESGVIIAIKEQRNEPSNPVSGAIDLPGEAEAEVVDPFEASPAPPGALIVEGRQGQARRRLQIEAE